MTRPLSLYLSLLRFLAAVAVYFFHAQHFAKARIPFFGNLGDEAVIVFFVLSGMLITVAGTRQPDVGAFVQARLSRLWSVCLPALALTLVADVAGQYISLASYDPLQPYSAFKWVATIGINASFLNQIWNFNVFPGTNGPFWSLSYEFWYYMMFTAFFYFQGRKRVLLLACAAIIAGPSILLAFPIWLLGTALYLVLKHSSTASAAKGWVFWLGSFSAIAAFSYFDLHNVLKNAFPQAAAAPKWSVNFWPVSYLIGVIVATNIYGFGLIGRSLAVPLEKASRAINFGADISFGLYLFHYPLMYLSKAVLNSIGLKSGAFFISVIYVVPFLISALLALQCERHKAVFSCIIRRAISTLARPHRLVTSKASIPNASNSFADKTSDTRRDVQNIK